MTQLNISEGYPATGTIEPTSYKVELHLVPLNCVFTNGRGAVVPSLKLFEYSGLNNNGFKNFQGFILIEASSFITFSSEVVINGVKTSDTESVVVWDTERTSLFPMSQAALGFELRGSMLFDDSTNAGGANKNKSISFKNHTHFLEIIK